VAMGYCKQMKQEIFYTAMAPGVVHRPSVCDVRACRVDSVPISRKFIITKVIFICVLISVMTYVCGNLKHLNTGPVS
jgi:hypothetical protein